MRNSDLGSALRQAAGIAARFELRGPVERVAPLGNGLINDTFLVAAGGPRYVLQRLNEKVFPAPLRIMENLAVLTSHVHRQGNSGLRMPELIPSRGGRPYVRAEDGGIWRLMEYIADTRTLSRVADLAQAREVGRILGRFHAVTDDLPAGRLVVTLPGFHVTPHYLARLEGILEQRGGSLSPAVTKAVTFARERRGREAVLEAARQKGRVRERVIHGDPKLDNILFDAKTSRAVSLIDLDTVQPGLVHYDIADCLRSCCNRKDETALGAHFDLDICEAILSAYTHQLTGWFSSGEIELLFDAARLIPLELGVRFLTDHLEGDRYFRVTESGQNLRKALLQFALVEDIEGKEREIRAIIDRCFGC